MRMKTMEITVGAFILAGLAALAALILNVSGLTVSTSDTSYKIYAHFENIGGLTARAKVTVAGVAIGKVTDIQIDTDRLMARVEMEVDEHVDYLTMDSSASILTAGLLGEKYIGITVGGDEELLVDGGVIEDTQSALVLEELVGKFLFNKVNE